MKMRKISWMMIAAAIFIICGGVIAVTIPTSTIANSATVSTPHGNIKAYWDEACTQPLEEIKWKSIYEGREYSKTFWVKNEGNNTVNAEWHDDIEEARIMKDDDSYMRYYNETTQWWRWWSEEWEIRFIPNATTTTVNSTGYAISPPPPPPPYGEPHLEPGEKAKVRYTIEFEISPLQEGELAAEKCNWNLTLGY